MTSTTVMKKTMTKKMRKCRISNSWISSSWSPVNQKERCPMMESCPAKPVVSTNAIVPMKPSVASSAKNLATTGAMAGGVFPSTISFIISKKIDAVTMPVTKMSAQSRSVLTCDGVRTCTPSSSSSPSCSSSSPSSPCPSPCPSSSCNPERERACCFTTPASAFWIITCCRAASSDVPAGRTSAICCCSGMLRIARTISGVSSSVGEPPAPPWSETRLLAASRGRTFAR
mmetsp:Transcript_45222/g.106509  ORF Transcript_45222/g.106509 Transcript_45222/m.106509 type:complete len:229 (-) Transcript_45222:259-945(-)